MARSDAQRKRGGGPTVGRRAPEPSPLGPLKCRHWHQAVAVAQVVWVRDGPVARAAGAAGRTLVELDELASSGPGHFHQSQPTCAGEHSQLCCCRSRFPVQQGGLWLAQVLRQASFCNTSLISSGAPDAAAGLQVSVGCRQLLITVSTGAVRCTAEATASNSAGGCRRTIGCLQRDGGVTAPATTDPGESTGVWAQLERGERRGFVETVKKR